MNKKRLMAILAAGVLTATSFNPAMIKAESVSAEEAGMAVPADAAGMSVPADGTAEDGLFQMLRDLRMQLAQQCLQMRPEQPFLQTKLAQW